MQFINTLMEQHLQSSILLGMTILLRVTNYHSIRLRSYIVDFSVSGGGTSAARQVQLAATNTSAFCLPPLNVQLEFYNADKEVRLCNMYTPERML